MDPYQTLSLIALVFPEMAIASTSPISIPSVPSPNLRSIRSVQFGVRSSIGRFGSSLNDRRSSVRCGGSSDRVLRTCQNCKKQFDVSLNHDQACRFHTAHFGGVKMAALKVKGLVCELTDVFKKD
ncbi:hypothetical protein QJS10_CPA01g01425 [Acorus calamus]|uniref:Uncharacterized protein n=1 Tax=Acorus calamus TaxID=4465 RepID=A0AAV9FND5_ACOCL|nr:hypothetical protein QJS10_CPA01g01425 [Acorus calamus]